MLIAQRQKRLLDILQEQHSAPLDSLSQILAVSSSTVRRDIEALETQGLVERTHGGVILRSRTTTSRALEVRMHEQVDAKRTIGSAAAKLVQPGMTLYIDGGSTIHYTVPQITARPLQVLTNSLNVANHFANDDRVELLVLGGTHYPRTGVLIGPITTKSLADLHADLLLFSVAAIFDHDIFNSNLAMAEIERLAISQCARRVLLMDSTKFGKKSLARVCSTDEVDLIITDPNIPDPWPELLGPRLQIAR